MKKLWIQYLILILCGAVMLCCFPSFAEQVKLAKADVKWQSSEYVNDYGDLVVPLPGDLDEIPWGDASSDTVTSADSSQWTSSFAASSLASLAASKSSSRASSAPLDPTVSTVPLPSSRPAVSSASSKLSSSAAASSSKPAVSSAAVSSAKPSSAAASSGSAGGEVLVVAVGGKAVEYTPAELLPRIAEAEIGGGSSPEAIKAQVIAAHTFIRYYNDIQNSAPSVAQKTPTEAAKKAAAEVLDLIITVGGKPVYTPYGAATAGRTNCSEEVWGGKLSHLRSVESKYDNLDAKNWGSKKTMTVDAVRAKLEAAGITVSGDPSAWFEVINYTEGGYNKNMRVCGQTECTIGGKKRTITGRVIRENILSLKSAKFEVSVSGSEITFTTYGYGHGVGLSQMGAHYYAKEAGWTYEQILTHYYTGVKLTKAGA